MKTVIEVKEDGLAYVVNGQERILCADQAQAWTLAEPTGPGIYPIPDLQWEVVALDIAEPVAILKESTPSDHIADVGKMAGKTVFKINPQYIHINGEDHWIDTIVCSSPTSTPSTEQKSQEELWSAVDDIVEDKIGKYYTDLPTGQLTFNIVEALKEQFTITRKP